MNGPFVSSYIKQTLDNTVRTPQPKHTHARTHQQLI